MCGKSDAARAGVRRDVAAALGRAHVGLGCLKQGAGDTVATETHPLRPHAQWIPFGIRLRRVAPAKPQAPAIVRTAAQRLPSAICSRSDAAKAAVCWDVAETFERNRMACEAAMRAAALRS